MITIEYCNESEVLRSSLNLLLLSEWFRDDLVVQICFHIPVFYRIDDQFDFQHLGS